MMGLRGRDRLEPDPERPAKLVTNMDAENRIIAAPIRFMSAYR
jgi:hypothetical protein